MAALRRSPRSLPLRTAAFLASFALHAGAVALVGGVGIGVAVATRASEGDDGRRLVVSVVAPTPAPAPELSFDPRLDDPRDAPTPQLASLEAAELETTAASDSDVESSVDLDALEALPESSGDASTSPAASSDIVSILAPIAPIATGRIPLRPGPSRAVPRSATASATTGGDVARPSSTPNADRASRGAPTILESPEADYPRLALEQKLEGKVVLLAHVDATGAVERCEVETSSGAALLDDAALAALAKWRFAPRLVDGKPLGFVVRVPFRFRLGADASSIRTDRSSAQ